MHIFITRYFRDETGAAAAEYALILAIVGAAISAACLVLGSAISTSVSTAATNMTTP